jgi:4-hydroxy-3-methylbut-2-enyl diphosphate reductase
MIHVAESAGFCSGVRRAVNIAVSAAEKHGKVFTLGQLVHNRDVICTLESKNVFAVENIADLPQNAVVIIRSHGVGKSVYEQLSTVNCQLLIDVTCPFVKKIHEIVAGKSGVVIAGDENHPEVRGIIGHAESCVVINSAEDFHKISENAQIFVAQTTFNELKWIECTKLIKKHCTNAQIFDTICNATVRRQQEARKLSEICDLMIVIGDRQSSNSVKLFEICKESCERVFFVENGQALPVLNLSPQTVVGITAGASVPAGIIKEVHEIMNEELKTVSETGAEFDFMAEVDKTFPAKIYAGRRVKALVVAVRKNEIVVDMGTKHSGYIPADEMGDSEGVKPGDEIECIVTKVNDAEGFVLLSKKQIDSQLGYEKLAAAYESGEALDGYVASVVNSGVIVTYEGTRIFVPASQSGVPKDGKLEELLKKTVKFKVIEVNEQRKRLVGSIRQASRVENDAAKAKFWEEIEVGKTYVGEIKSMESYGVFVDLGGVDGMVHLSELTWKRVKHPKDAVAIGDKLEVAVKSYDPEKRRVSLTAKNPDENPWTKFMDEYTVGSVAKVTIVNITPFGAFAQIIPGIDGLIHISQVSRERIKSVSEVLQVGQEVEAQITEIDADKERVSISVKALLEPEEGEFAEEQEVVEQEVVEEPAAAEEAE